MGIRRQFPGDRFGYPQDILDDYRTRTLMASISSIEWTETTWNPVTGCLKVSQGCKHCYAERMATRLYAMGSERYANGFKPTLHYDLIDLPRRWKKPRVIFVNSMSDLFQDDVPEAFIRAVFATMEACPQHTFQILTKRSERLRNLGATLPWPSNVWMGVSVENARVIDQITDLAAVPAKVRFLLRAAYRASREPSAQRNTLGDCRRRVRPLLSLDAG
jgi:protein gp37